jgi:hypothetical protein
VIRVSDYSSWSGATFVLLVAKGSNPSLPPPIRPPVLPPTPRLPALPVIATRVIETSTNLVNWQPWHTNAAQTNWTFSIGTEPQRFFRWAK